MVNPDEIRCGNGIKVDEFMQTSVPEIYAAGDVAQTRDVVLGEERLNTMWTAATRQGRIAGANMAGGKVSYLGSLGMNSVDFGGLSVMSAGVVRPGQSAGWEVHESRSPGSYRKLVFQGDRLAGYILAGDTANGGISSAPGILTNLIYRQIPCREKILESFPKVQRLNIFL